MSQPVLLLVTLAAAMVAFAVVYLIARRLDNFGVVDVAWSLAFGPVALFYGLAENGAPLRRILITTMAGLWSLRLGLHLARRVLGHLKVEDARYRQLRQEWGPQGGVRMFLFFQAQAGLVAVLSLPFALAAGNVRPGLGWCELAGVLLWCVAWAGEALADAQLAAFKRAPGNRGQVCATGLWAWSRHPNYFCEWLVWVAFALFAFDAPFGWTALVCPALMLHFLLRVTGIPYTEQQLLRSKGEAYAAYRARTSAFLPWPPRRPSAARS